MKSRVSTKERYKKGLVFSKGDGSHNIQIREKRHSHVKCISNLSHNLEDHLVTYRDLRA